MQPTIALRLTVFATITVALFLFLEPHERTWDAVLGMAIAAAFLTVFAAPLIAWLSRKLPPKLQPSQWPWYAMQLGIIGGTLYLAYVIAQHSGKPPAVGVAFIFGFCLAALATGIIGKLLDMSLVARTALARLIQQRRKA